MYDVPVRFFLLQDRMVMGVARTSSVMSDKARRAVAYHEAGHALVALVSEHAKDVRKATIIPHGLAMGMVVQMPDKDEAPQTFAQMKATLDVYMGGERGKETSCMYQTSQVSVSSG